MAHRFVCCAFLGGVPLLLQQGCSSVGDRNQPRPNPVASASAVVGGRCAPLGPEPSRNAFFHEVLFAARTDRTARFDDYTLGSYHVNKLDLVRGLPNHARECGVRLKAVLVLGPSGLLWTYHVVALAQESTQVRVNSLVMPHARITGKGTGLVSPERASELLHQLETAPLVLPGIPAPPPDDMTSDFSYGMLLAVYDPDGPRYFHAGPIDGAEGPGRQALLDRINSLLAATKGSTYEHGQ
jgi:hypothetical protein